MNARCRANVNNMIRLQHGIFVVLYHNQRIAQIPQMLQRGSSFALSLWCRPILGSSSIYSTPTRPEPICVAKRMRCASPPESVPASGKASDNPALRHIKIQPGANFFQNLLSDHGVTLRKLKRIEKGFGLTNRHIG